MHPRALLAELELLGMERERPLIIGALKFSATTPLLDLEKLTVELRREPDYIDAAIHHDGRENSAKVLGFAYEVGPNSEFKTLFEEFGERLIHSLRKRFGKNLLEWEIVGAMHLMRPVIRTASPRPKDKKHPRQLIATERVRVPLTAKQRDLIINETSVGGELRKRVRDAPSDRTRCLLDLTLDEIEELLRVVTAEANHSAKKRTLQRELDAIGDVLEELAEKFDVSEEQ